MSRAINVKLSVEDVIRKCENAGVSISTVETLPSGDTRLVCTTGDGAEEMRSLFGKHVTLGAQKSAARTVPPSQW